MPTTDPVQRVPRTYAIIGAAMEVHRQLGPGFHEAVYLEALRIELERRKIPFTHEVGLRIRYKDQLLDTRYRADLTCYGTVLVELKALTHLSGTEEAQRLKYMMATGSEVGLLLNSGTARLYYKRYAYNPAWSPIAAEAFQPGPSSQLPRPLPLRTLPKPLPLPSHLPQRYQPWIQPKPLLVPIHLSNLRHLWTLPAPLHP